MNADPPKAIVIGDMDIVRPLGLAGIPVVAAGRTGSETRWSRYAVDHLELPDLWREAEIGVGIITEYARKQQNRPVLIYAMDPAALAVSRHRRELSQHVDFVVADPELIEDLIDKERFIKLAEDLDLPVPRSVIVSNQDPHAADELTYPVIVKPVLRNRPFKSWIPVAGAAKAVECVSPADLQHLLSREQLEGFALVVQEAVAGPESEVYSYHAYIDQQGNTIAEFTGRKLRTWPVRFGQSTAVEIVADQPAMTVGRQTLRKLGLTGVAKVDFKRSPEGDLKLLEVNPRFNLWHHPAAIAGINIPALVYRDLTGCSVDLVPARDGVRWCQVWHDWRAARETGLGTAEWLSFAVGAEARRAVHVDDPGAILGALKFGISGRGRQTGRRSPRPAN